MREEAGLKNKCNTMLPCFRVLKSSVTFRGANEHFWNSNTVCSSVSFHWYDPFLMKSSKKKKVVPSHHQHRMPHTAGTTVLIRQHLLARLQRCHSWMNHHTSHLIFRCYVTKSYSSLAPSVHIYFDKNPHHNTCCNWFFNQLLPTLEEANQSNGVK